MGPGRQSPWSRSESGSSDFAFVTKTIDVRRHAERADRASEASGLSTAGLAMARSLRSRTAPFSLVISSPRERARATAIAIADRVDELEPRLGGCPDDALTQAQYDTLVSQTAVAELLRMNAPSARLAEGQLAIWRSVARRLDDGGAALLVTHGGNIELPAVLLAIGLNADVGPLPLGYCEGVRIRFEEGEPVAVGRLDVLGGGL